MNLIDITSRILNDLKISLAEHFVMITIGYEIYLPLDSLAQVTFKEVEGDPRGNFSIEEYRKAIETCIAKNLLITVTPEIYSKLTENDKRKIK